jgi:hypothetical protein
MGDLHLLISPTVGIGMLPGLGLTASSAGQAKVLVWETRLLRF